MTGDEPQPFIGIVDEPVLPSAASDCRKVLSGDPVAHAALVARYQPIKNFQEERKGYDRPDQAATRGPAIN